MKKGLLFICFLFANITFVASQNNKGVSPISDPGKSILGTTYAVVVGVSDYQNPDIPDLIYAHKDAFAFSQYLKSPAGGNVPESNIKILLNEEATAAQFASALDWLMEKTKEGDQAIIFFSGHGDVERKTITQPGFLLCWNAPSKVYMGGGTFGLVYLQEIISTLSLQSKAKVIVITDACRSGKLAGSEIGGPHATAANLAKQYANEIKIMSCQPDELSLEGPEWGGGRGVFSYYFLNGITGLADKNKDGMVSLFEIERFLGDKVPEAVSPKIQIPITIGNKGTVISLVDPVSLLALQENEDQDIYSGELVAFNYRNSGEPDHKSQNDPIIKEKYNLFKKALKDGHLMFPEENSAWSLYQQIKDSPVVAAELLSIQSSLAASLQDQAQQAINDYLKADPEDLRRRWNLNDYYNRFPVYLNKAAELLGSKHFLYRDIKAREHYFTGLNQRLAGERNNDNSLFEKAISEQNQAIELDSAAAYAYNELGLLQRRLKNYSQSIMYFNQALVHSPTWVLPWANIAMSYYDQGEIEKGLTTASRSIALNPNFTLGYFNLAHGYQLQSNWSKARELYIRILDIDKKERHALMNLAAMYYMEKNYEKAGEIINDYKIKYPTDTYVYLPLTCIYLMKSEEEKAYEAIEMGFKDGFKDVNAIESEPDLKEFIKTPRYLELKAKYLR